MFKTVKAPSFGGSLVGQTQCTVKNAKIFSSMQSQETKRNATAKSFKDGGIVKQALAR